MKKTLSVEAKRHNDIRGKELLYLLIGEGKDQIAINVGQKTFDSVAELIEGPKVDPAQLTIQGMEKEPVTNIQILPPLKQDLDLLLKQTGMSEEQIRADHNKQKTAK